MRFLTVALTLGAVLCGASAPAAPPPSPRPEPKVSLPAGAELKDILPRLGEAGVGVVVADAGTLRRKLPTAAADLPLPQVLDRLSKDFDHYWIRRGTSLVLQSRLRDTEEDAFLELEELRAAASDWAALVRPFAPRLGGLEFINLKSAFLESLSPEQVRMAMQGGLPIAAMAPKQRGALLQINARHCWDNVDRELNRARLCFDNWKRLSLENLHPGQLPSEMTIRIPPGADDAISVLYVQPGNRRPASPRATGEVLPAPSQRVPSDLTATWRLPVQKTTLEELMRGLAREGGPEVEVPAYARVRSLWIHSAAGRRWDVLQAICDLWGWELITPPRSTGYRLGRPAIKRATDVHDLHVRMRRTVPPVLWHQVWALSQDTATERWGRDIQVVLDEIQQRQGLGWKRFPLSSLSLRAQRHLAHVIAWRQYYTWFSSHGRASKPYPWAVAPEQGAFHLSGELGPGKHPLARIIVPAEKGQPSWWGWAVNTSKVEAFPPKN